MLESPLYYLTDAVLRAPTLGCMLMCLSSALVGVVALLRRQALLGESLSHAAYPGVNIGIIVAAIFACDFNEDFILTAFILLGAFCTGLLGLWIINAMQKYLKVRSDSALCFVLSAFFGIGITLASHLQFSHTNLYNQIQVYLYGQAATMTDVHVLIYGVLSVITIALLLLLYKEIQIMLFDYDFAKSLGIKTRTIDTCIFILMVASVVIGIRSVGVVLMSAMLIAPAVAARQFTNKLYAMFLLSAFFGVTSGFLGNYLSTEISQYLVELYPAARLVVPTGPMIVLVAASICILALLFAPERGFLLRFVRIARFRYTCTCENLLKAMWRLQPTQAITFEAIAKQQSASNWYLRFIISRLLRSGWVEQASPETYLLTKDGLQKALRIVRLHRLWEVYLADYVGVGAEKVHRNAEEMEHIITPELERKLTELLKDPKQDPHHQPIPPKDIL